MSCGTRHGRRWRLVSPLARRYSASTSSAMPYAMRSIRATRRRAASSTLLRRRGHRVTLDVARIRRAEFPWMDARAEVYMNAASTGPSPMRSIAAQREFIERRAAPHTVDYEDQFGTLARCRDLVASLLNARTSEIAMATNTGAGINLAAWGLPLGRGDTMVVPDGACPAHMYPWLGRSTASGFDVPVVALPNGPLGEEAPLSPLPARRPQAPTVSWTSFASGDVADLATLGAACHARGIVFVVDGIQGLGPLTIDMAKVPVDILACGAQKWLLSPWGSGFTFVRREMLDVLTPQPVSWMALRGSPAFSRLSDYDLPCPYP